MAGEGAGIAETWEEGVVLLGGKNVRSFAQRSTQNRSRHRGEAASACIQETKQRQYMGQGGREADTDGNELELRVELCNLALS